MNRKRLFDVKKRFVGPSQFNGGVTHMLVPPGSREAFAADPWRIIVYRREDAAKVMLHELIHFYRLDGDMVSDGVEKSWIGKHDALVRVGPPVNQVNLHEAVTETLACYAHAVLSAKLGLGPRKGARACCFDMQKRIDRVAATVLFDSDGNLRGFTDGTHAFAYLVARSALWDATTHAPHADLFHVVRDVTALPALLDRLIDHNAGEWLRRLSRALSLNRLSASIALNVF